MRGRLLGNGIVLATQNSTAYLASTFKESRRTMFLEAKTSSGNVVYPVNTLEDLEDLKLTLELLIERQKERKKRRIHGRREESHLNPIIDSPYEAYEELVQRNQVHRRNLSSMHPVPLGTRLEPADDIPDIAEEQYEWSPTSAELIERMRRASQHRPHTPVQGETE